MTPLPAQNGPELSGRWEGTLDVDGNSTRVTLTVLEHSSGYSAFVDTDRPLLGVNGITTVGRTIPVDRVEFVGGDVLFELSAIQGTYLVRPSDDGRLIAGMWRQATSELPLILVRAADGNEADGPYTE